jgi:hypothetical protein
MAGATPGVLANHGALTRPFDISDELELEDKLDKKPDDERSPVTASVKIFLEDVEYFLSSLERLRTKGQFDPNKDSFAVTKNTLLPCVDSNLAGRYTPIKFTSTSEQSRSAMEYFTRGMEYGYSLGDCVSNDVFNGITAANSRFDFQLDRTEFSVKVCVKKESSQRALDLVRALESTIALYSTPHTSKLRKTIIESTTFRAENDQVFVITRLPRGSLASLFATDAK